MDNPIKKIAAIHDLSGYGRGSLTTIIPILSSMGIQVCPFPTSILSSHTEDYNGFSFVDLTDSMINYMNHWKKENIEFDCIYTGFLGSADQVDIILKFIDNFKLDNNILVVDPVMGTDGELYKTITNLLVDKMKTLVSKADIITPNLTEAFYLLNKPYNDIIDEEDVKDMLIKLSHLGPKKVILTSVPDINNPNNINVYAYEKENNNFLKVSSKLIPVKFPGTGDAFASVLIGYLLRGNNLLDSITYSTEFISHCITESIKYDYPTREGILFERLLKTLDFI